MPYVFWISAFTYPTGFTTSLKQRYSRKSSQASIDKLDFDYTTTNRPVAEVTEQPKEGAYVYGLYLEGARWDEELGQLAEPNVMELYCPMPVMHFKPIIKRAKNMSAIYQCPTYYYPLRQGSVTRESF